MPVIISVKKLYWCPSENISNGIIKNINMELKNNDFIVLRGSSGSGKSTCLKVLAGRLPASSGTLQYYDDNIEAISSNRLKKIKNKIGYISEDLVFIDNKNVYKNIEYLLKLKNTPRELLFDRIIHILKLTGLISKRDLYPGDLSLSEKKVLALAMAFSIEPDILLCDLNLTGYDDDREVFMLLKNATYRGAGVIVTAKESVEFKIGRVKYFDIINGEIK